MTSHVCFMSPLCLFSWNFVTFLPQRHKENIYGRTTQETTVLTLHHRMNLSCPHLYASSRDMSILFMM